MPKRSATELETSTRDGEPFRKSSGSGQKRENVTTDEMGEFEDAWEDEIESDEDVVDTGAQGEDGAPEDMAQEDRTDIAVGMEVDEVLPAIEESEQPQPAPEAFIPGHHVLGKDEILEPDDTVYIIRHALNVNWPSLSFDILRDNLGDERQRYPATAYIVSGTQADTAKSNELIVYKMSSLHRTQRDGADSDEEDDDDNDALDEDAVLEHKKIPHFGGVNRVRAQPLPAGNLLPPLSQPYHVATWAETGKVHIWNVRPLIEALDVPGYTYNRAQVQTPVFTINSHGRAEGFAIDWASSGPSSLRLLTGDIHSKIYLTTSSPSGFNALSQPFLSHISSVEDIQWSPTEPTVFASCSADQSLQIWDVRSRGRRSVAGIMSAHESDVNVISWNRTTTYLIVSGGDEGGIKTWDLRNVKKRDSGEADPAPVAHFTWHSKPITSIEWHPTEDSIFAASGADDQITLWDLAVEQDTEEAGIDDTPGGEREVPPQLLFVHQGQKDVKEVHWHPQIPGVVISTASDGFNIFKTISV